MISFIKFLAMPENYYLEAILPPELLNDEDSIAYAFKIKEFLISKQLIQILKNGNIHSDELIKKIRKKINIRDIEKKVEQRFHRIDPEYEKDLQEAKEIFYQKINLIINHLQEQYKEYIKEVYAQKK